MNTYLVKECFRTIQGEGARAGAKSVFVRFAGCNLWNGRPQDRVKGEGACARWCDTDFFKGQALTTDEVLVAMDACWPALRESDERWCVLTGGEPMLQVDDELIDALHAKGWKVAMETNGTVDAPVLAQIDWLTVSPKLGSTVKVTKAHELKVVLPGALPPDPGWTEDVLELMGMEGQYKNKFVQPQDPIDAEKVNTSYLTQLGGRTDLAGIYRLHIERCVSFVDRHPDWRMGIQQHKLVGVP